MLLMMLKIQTVNDHTGEENPESVVVDEATTVVSGETMLERK